MKTPSSLAVLLLASVFALGQAGFSFTYQGHLMRNGVPTPVATPTTNVVAVSNGQFTVTLPGGPAVFNGSRRFLQISVRTNGSAEDFTVLAPNQEIFATPYATRAAVATTAENASTVALQSIGPEGILAVGTPGPGKVLMHNGTAWVWTNLQGAATAWLLGGNSNTVPGTNFMGTADGRALELAVNRQRALRLEPNSNGAPNVIGGDERNAAASGVAGASIAGGGTATLSNVVAGNHGSIGGGAGNRAATFSVAAGGESNAARGDHAAVGGGLLNDVVPGPDTYFFGVVPASSSVIGGGEQNQILSVYSVIAGGTLNSIGTNAGDSFIGGGLENAIGPEAYFSTLGGGMNNNVKPGAEFGVLGGGEQNTLESNAWNSVLSGGFQNFVAGTFAVVPGGKNNRASGRASLAAGERAHAAHPGTFVWAGGAAGEFASSTSNQFLIHAPGGVGIGTNDPRAQLHVRGTNMADVFKGAFVGDGSGLTNLGVAGASPNTAYVNSNQTFTASNVFSGVVAANNPNNQFSGSGAGLTSLNASNIASGTLADTRLSANVALRNATNTFTASNLFSGAVTATNNGNRINGAFNGTFAGNGASLTNLNPTNLSPGTAGINISGNAATATTAQSFGGSLAGDVTGLQSATLVNRLRGVNVSAAAPAANQVLRYDGANWTPGAVALGTDVSGTLNDARLSANVARLNSNQLFTASNIFAGVVLATNASNRLSGVFTGDGTALNLSNAINTVAIQSNSITATKIAVGQVVKSLNGLTDSVTLSNGANITITPAGNTLTIAATGGGSASNAWNLAGNAGANPTNGNFLGTTDNLPLELKVNSARALRLEPGSNGAPNVIGGAAVNQVLAGVGGATIAGGGSSGLAVSNSVSANFGTIGGGRNNAIQIVATEATIAGGLGNTIQSNAAHAVIGGGQNNVIQAGAFDAAIHGGWNNTIQTNAYRSTIGGGNGHTIQASALASTIGGGSGNVIQTNATGGVIAGGSGHVIQTNAQNGAIGGGSGNVISNSANYGAIPGGVQNAVGGSYGFAAGRQAKAAHQGAFVWADSTGTDFVSTSNNQFNVRAGGGVRLVTGGAGATLDGVPILTGGASANTAYLNSNQTFTASNTFSGVVTANNAANQFSGNGAGLTGLNAGNLASGVVPSARLGTNVAFLSSNQTFTGANSFLGAVGIGTTAPGTTLEVNGGVRARGGPPGGFGNNNNGYAFSGNDGDNDSGMFSSADGQLEFYSNAGERMRISNLGRVGIGTTTPGDLLSLQDGALSFQNTNNPVPYVGMDYDHASDSLRLRANLFSTALNTTHLTLQRTSGNVGIGTTSPSAQLHVATSGGDNNPALSLSQTNSDYARLRFTQVGGYSKRWDFGARSNDFTIYSGHFSKSFVTMDTNGVHTPAGLVIETRNSDPPAPATGQIWLRTDL